MWQRLDQAARVALPFIVAVVCTLLGALVWPLPYFGAVAPPLALMAVYFWSMHRPDLFRPGFAFIIGLLHDIVNFLPLGLSALLFVLVHQVVLRNRRYFIGHSFLMMWSGFILAIIGTMFLQWSLLSLFRWQMYPVLPILAQLMIAIALFPLPCWLFITLQRHTLNTEQ